MSTEKIRNTIRTIASASPDDPKDEITLQDVQEISKRHDTEDGVDIVTRNEMKAFLEQQGFTFGGLFDVYGPAILDELYKDKASLSTQELFNRMAEEGTAFDKHRRAIGIRIRR